MIPMAVAEDDRLYAGEVDAEPVGVGDHGVGRQARIEEQCRGGGAASHADQRGEPVLGHEPDGGGTGLELGCLGGAGSEHVLLA